MGRPKIRVNSEEIKNFHFEPKLPFLRENKKNDNSGAFPDFYEFTLYMIFANVLKMAISIMAIFSKIFQNRMKGGLVKI